MEKETTQTITNNNEICQGLFDNLDSQILLLKELDGFLKSRKLQSGEAAICITHAIMHTAETLANYYDVTYPKNI